MHEVSLPSTGSATLPKLRGIAWQDTVLFVRKYHIHPIYPHSQLDEQVN